MKLIYKKTGKPVQQGDEITIDGDLYKVAYFRPPHKPESSGKVTVSLVKFPQQSAEFYVGVIDAEWIEREDQPERSSHDIQ